MIIRSHSVPVLASGLSPMQERLLHSEKLVRLVSAPTGSGKSYAFMQAVLNEGVHVLFIVPTKRLLQNLIGDAREQARTYCRDHGMTDAQIDAWLHQRITEWSGNQAQDGSESLAAMRVRQFLAGSTHSSGRVIFAIPEVVVGMISGIRVTGASAVNPFLYLRCFDHIVFDEFHTIDDRAFGLACLLSLLAGSERRAKVSLLSATPIDVTKILGHTGVGADDIEMISEDIVDGHTQENRSIHGNVEIVMRACSLVESIALSIDAVRASIAGGFTVIVIYDSLQRLKREDQDIRKTLWEAGVPEKRILSINSIDDSARRPGARRRGRTYADPRHYDVLLCTSSVEIGVTFHSTLMFMEPGFGLANFVQRVGRVSRGADDGQVIVSLPDRQRERHAWTRRIADVIEGHDEVSVQEFTAQILRDIRRQLEPTRTEAEVALAAVGEPGPFYRRASWRGAYWAALFIVAIRRRRMNVQKEARERLYQLSPSIVKFVDSRISEICKVDVVNDNMRRVSQPHKRWVDALLASALAYRDIGATIEVADPNGERHTVTESFLRRATDILNRHIASDEDGERTVHLMSRTLDEEIRVFAGRPDAQRLTLYVPSPIGDGSFSLSILEQEKKTEQLNALLVKEWRHRFESVIPAVDDRVRDPRMTVMGAATALVEKLGRPPLDEDFEDSAESALFA